MENAKQANDQTDLSNSRVNVHDSREVVIGSGNIITRIFNALGRRQFRSLAGGLIVLIVGGYYGFRTLSGGQDAAYASLSDIQKELGILADLNADVRARLENDQGELENWLTKGMDALKTGDYPVAIQYLEKVAEQAPLAGVRQNLSYAYEQIGNADKARENLEEAKRINPNLDTSKSYAQLKGKRINLLAPENGGILKIAVSPRVEVLVDGIIDERSINDPIWAVWGFKDERKARFDEVSYYVPSASGSHLNQFILSYGDDPRGAFTVIDTFKLFNGFIKDQPFQAFKFPAVSAKYVRFEALGCGICGMYELQLLGEL